MTGKQEYLGGAPAMVNPAFIERPRLCRQRNQ
jgi:hypothetical protein